MSEMMKVSEVAERLKVSKFTVYNMIKDGELEAYRMNSRTIRISRDALDRYIEGCKIK